MRMTEKELLQVKVDYLVYGALGLAVFALIVMGVVNLFMNTPPEMTCICAGELIK